MALHILNIQKLGMAVASHVAYLRQLGRKNVHPCFSLIKKNLRY